MNNSIYIEKRLEKRLEKIVERFETPDDNPFMKSGFLTHHVSFDYPEKGWRDIHIIKSVNYVKRFTITWIRFVANKYMLPFYLTFALLPWRFKIKILDKMLAEYCSVADYYLHLYEHKYYLNPRYYSPLTLELMNIINIILIEIGISADTSKRFSFIFVSLIEYDRAYYPRVEDLFSETTKEKMLENPKKEIEKLMQLFIERDFQRVTLQERFYSFAKLVIYALYLPRFKRAFKKAFINSKFENLQFDDADRYHVREKGSYNWFGMTEQERNKKWPPQQHTLIEVLYDDLNDLKVAEIFGDQV
ncbi:MAG: hypothetical protein AABY22_10025 [Nanoarchaeota archaeon]